MPFDMNIPSLLTVLLFSSVGFVYMGYGKKMSEYSFVAAGLGLMLFGYFVDTLIWEWVLGLGLCALPFVLRR